MDRLSSPTVSTQLRQEGHERDRTPARSAGWACPFCPLTSHQTDSLSLWRHFQNLHHDILIAKGCKTPDDAPEWWQGLLQQAFLSRNQPPDETSAADHHSPGQTTRTNTFGTEEFQRLSIGYDGRDLAAAAAPPIREGLPAPGVSQTASCDEASRVAVVSRTSSPSSRLHHPHSHQNILHRKQLSRSTTLASDVDFRKHTLQNREALRVNEPSDEDTDDARRKRQSTHSTQPSVSSPALNSPRQQIPLPRNRGILQAEPQSRYPGMLLEPDSRGISQDQLTTEVKAIYHALTTLETKCIKLDKEQAIASQKGPISPNVWRVLIGIHRRLLNDHHDFFLASQHPSASAPLHRLALKYNMPARMWKHGIHVFLELLRHQLPHSLEFMISFIYLAYQMMSLLLETVPSFKETWIECLGDLSRYRMAVEEEDMRDRDNWGNVAKYWYAEAADKLPNTGRLYHHLAILARPDGLQQNFLFTKSLIATQPFISARESIMTLFDPLIKDGSTYISKTDVAFIKTSAFIFYRRHEDAKVSQAEFLSTLPNSVAELGTNWKVPGVYVATVTIGALFDYGVRNTMLQIFEVGNYLVKNPDGSKDAGKLAPQTASQADAETDEIISIAESYFFCTFRTVFTRFEDQNCHTYTVVVLGFLLSLVSFDAHLDASPELQQRARKFLKQVPWTAVCRLLNSLLQSGKFESRFEVSDFPRTETGEVERLPEDVALRGSIFTSTYYPGDFFDGIHADDDRAVEHPSTGRLRGLRQLWIGYKLSEYGCLIYNKDEKSWHPNMDSPWANQSVEEKFVQKSTKESEEGSDSVPVPPQPFFQSMEDARILVAVEALERDEASIVFDTKLMLRHKDMFKYLVDEGWHVAVHEELEKKLRQYSKHDGPFDVATLFNDIKQQVQDDSSTAHVLKSDGHMSLSFRSTKSELSPSPGSDEAESWEIVNLVERASAQDSRTYVVVADDPVVIAHAQEKDMFVATTNHIRVALMSKLNERPLRAPAEGDDDDADAMEGVSVSP